MVQLQSHLVVQPLEQWAFMVEDEFASFNIRGTCKSRARIFSYWILRDKNNRTSRLRIWADAGGGSWKKERARCTF